MTYFQIMNKALEFYIKEPLDKELFEYWGIFIENEEDILDIKEAARKEQTYLWLSQLKKYGLLSTPYMHLFIYLESVLATTYIDKSKTIENALEVVRMQLEEDLFYMDAKCVLEDKDSYENYSKEALQKLKDYKEKKEKEGIKEYLAQGHCERKVKFSAMQNIIYDIVTVLPELFFTEAGSKYIDEKYRIQNEDLRDQCYDYVIDNMSAFIWENNCIHDYRAISYTLTLTNVVLDLVKENKLEELKNLMEIDEYLEEHADTYTSVVNRFFNVLETSKFKFSDKAFSDTMDNEDLLFVLGDSRIHNCLSNEQIAAVLLYPFKNKNFDQNEIKNEFLNIISNNKSFDEKEKVKKRNKNSNNQNIFGE